MAVMGQSRTGVHSLDPPVWPLVGSVIPYDALGMELTPDYHERTSLFGFKTGFQFIGVPADVLPTALGGHALVATARSQRYCTRWTASHRFDTARRLHDAERLGWLPARWHVPIQRALTFRGSPESLPRISRGSAYANDVPCQRVASLECPWSSPDIRRTGVPPLRGASGATPVLAQRLHLRCGRCMYDPSDVAW